VIVSGWETVAFCYIWRSAVGGIPYGRRRRSVDGGPGGRGRHGGMRSAEVGGLGMAAPCWHLPRRCGGGHPSLSYMRGWRVNVFPAGIVGAAEELARKARPTKEQDLRAFPSLGRCMDRLETPLRWRMSDSGMPDALGQDGKCWQSFAAPHETHRCADCQKRSERGSATRVPRNVTAGVSRTCQIQIESMVETGETQFKIRGLTQSRPPCQETCDMHPNRLVNPCACRYCRAECALPCPLPSQA